MKKEMMSTNASSIVVYGFLAIVLSYILIGLLAGIFNIVQLSPFFPEFAPFEASVTIQTNFNPAIIDLDNEIFVCEGNRTNHFFNVSDLDRNLLFVRINDPPPIPVFAEIFSVPVEPDVTYDARIFSGITDKNDIGSHNEVVEALDSTSGSDSRNVNITIIEKNNFPNVETIGVQTIDVFTRGENSTFYKQLMADDIEDRTSNDEILGFNLSFLNYRRLFNISDNGTMFFDPNKSLNLSEITLPLILDLRACVNDTGILNIHPRIMEFCGQDGSPWEICQDFSLTLTDRNRAPIITDFNPTDLFFKAQGGSDLYFNITAKDPDGTIPDVYWYVDDVSKKYDNFSNFSEFMYQFACGVSGNHSVRVDATDGLLNDSVEWIVDVSLISCPSQPSSGGGGAGSIIRRCEEDWGCLNWNLCQDVGISLEQGLLSKEDFSLTNENCQLDNFQDYCGFQLRDCIDLNFCNTTREKPEILQHCYFVEDPSCSDGIKDCHSGSCEVLVDCGGPCKSCPTCSDGIQNQGEKDTDCSGPCPLVCTEKEIISFRFNYILIVIILILLIIVIIQLIRIYRSRKKMQKYAVESRTR